MSASVNQTKPHFCHFPAARVGVAHPRKTFYTRSTLREFANPTLAAGKWQKCGFDRFTDADKKSGDVALLHFPAGKVKVFGVGNVRRALTSSRTPKTLTFPAEKCKSATSPDFLSASVNQTKPHFCHFPAARVGVAHPRKTFYTRSTLREFANPTLAAGKWQKCGFD